jgi:hypothetical protein
MVPEGIDTTLNCLCLSLIRLNRGDLLGDIQLLQTLGYCLVGVYLPPFVVEVCRNLVPCRVSMDKKKDLEVDHVRTDDLRTRRIAGSTMWDDAARPTIEGCLRSDGLLPRVPFFELLLSAPDGVTGRATLVGMRLDAPRLHQLAREDKLCTSLCPHIGGVNSAHAMMSMVGESSSKRSGSVVWCFFLLSLKEDLRTLRPVEIGTFSNYLHAHMPKINSSPVKILKSSWKVPGKFSKLGLKKILNSRSAVVRLRESSIVE